MIKEKDLITIHDHINIHKDDYKTEFDVAGEIDDDLLAYAFNGIFRKSGFLKAIDWQLSRPWSHNKESVGEYIKFFFEVKENLDAEIMEIDNAIRFIDDQVEELEGDIEASNEEISGAEIEFENTENEIVDLTGDNNCPNINSVPYGKEIKEAWKINYNKLDDDERDEVEDLMLLLQDHYEIYKTAMEEKEDAESILEKAEENATEADEWLDAIQGYNYD